MTPAKVMLLAAAAIIAFAGNSLFARAALADGAMGAGAYSAFRLAAGALILLPVLGRTPGRADLFGATALAIYIGSFSFAYISLGAASGALILFACVQATILLIAAIRGDAPALRGWLGMALALAGVAYLLAPGAGAVEIAPALLMAMAGAAWGVYTLLGRGAGDPAGRTARNFLLATPMVLPMLLLDSAWPTGFGVVMAVLSGALTSGLGYVVWYAVAPRMGLATVAAVQLATPVVAALGGALLLAEPLTLSLALASTLILGGILLTLERRN
ncbi:hypothetical protein AAV99_03020 [Aurantiacibacter marinus]|uniref:EamA domain-containing protein n=2 Tax=Aurantiacibacter marinus TaxID=874156 RepID=A0A0H0XTA0_9SPHN|nr:hypothetical protein AAV99_03020 [Aurantiacibacter marinus]